MKLLSLCLSLIEVLSVVLVPRAKLLSVQHKQIFVLVNIRAASLFHILFFVLFLINCYLTLCYIYYYKYNNIINIINMAGLDLHCCVGFFCSCSEHGLLCGWHRLLITVASPVVEHGL